MCVVEGEKEGEGNRGREEGRGEKGGRTREGGRGGEGEVDRERAGVEMEEMSVFDHLIRNCHRAAQVYKAN